MLIISQNEGAEYEGVGKKEYFLLSFSVSLKLLLKIGY
jgi:hypothetical protein